MVEGHLSESRNPDNTAEDIRFTANDKIIYAICLDVPSSTSMTINSLNRPNRIGPGSVLDVRILGDEQALTWEFTDTSFVIHLQEIPDLNYAVAFRIQTTNQQVIDQ